MRKESSGNKVDKIAAGFLSSGGAAKPQECSRLSRFFRAAWRQKDKEKCQVCFSTVPKPESNTVAKKLIIPILLTGLILLISLGAILFPVMYTDLKEEATENIKQISNQSIQYIEQTMTQFELYSQFINQDESLLELIHQYSTETTVHNRELINQRLTDYVSNYANIFSISLILDNHDFSSTGSFMEADSIKKSDWYKDYIENQYNRHYSPPFEMDSSWRLPFIHVVFPYENKWVKGNMVFLLYFNVFEEPLEAFKELSLDVSLCGRDNRPFYDQFSGTHSRIQYDLATESMEQNRFFEPILLGNQDGFDYISYTQQSGWKLVVHISNEYILGGLSSTILLFAILTIAYLIASVGLSILIVSRRLIPLKLLTKQMNEIRDGHMVSTVEIHTGDELEVLGNTFNHMILRIKKDTEEKMDQYDREKKMEYALLIANVNPHFIYKALNIITFLSSKNENRKVIEVNQALIRILKDSLRIHKVEIYDTIEQELSVISSYIVIQKVRYGDHIAFTCDVPPEVLQEQIPKNIMEPLIENAIFHGLLMNLDENKKVIPGLVHLSVTKEEDQLILKVTDTGIGMTKEEIQKYFYSDCDRHDNRGEHIGIKNIRKRLDYLLQENYSMEAKSEPGEGTEVTILLKGRKP